MVDRAHDIRGFTLAELLLAIAIMVVLFALAVPSIFSIQKNMRMVELDAAASDIAIAAQHQMTAMKVSGTWVALLDEHSELTKNEAKATGVPSQVTDAHPEPNDLYYLTAAQARDLGILPSGSIDDTVRDGDYIIEYSASTASIFGVFYTDGKTGFFQTPTGEPKAQEYYQIESATKRTQQSRMGNDPLIGYFGGTPAGATNAVALANPNIWVNDQGRLCIQDPNLSKHSEWNTYLEVLIEGQDGTSKTLALAGLQASGGMMTYAAGTSFEKDSNGEGGLTVFDNTNDTKLYEVQERDQFSAGADVYVFDLDMFTTTSSEALRELGQGFDSGKPIKVTARVATHEVPYTPAESTAYMEWPKTVTTVRVLVTDPATEENKAGGTHIKGTYSAPEVKLRLSGGGSFVGDNHLETFRESHAIQSTNGKLIEENAESAWQRYVGGQIEVGQAVQDRVNIEAAVGFYTSLTTRKVHWYQVQEIWLGVGADPDKSTKERIGYLTDNAWRWVGSGTTLKGCIGVSVQGETDGIVEGENTNGILQLIVDTEELAEAAKELNIDGEVISIYLRTAPNVDETRLFFTGKESVYGGSYEKNTMPGGLLDDIIAGMTTNRTTGARGINHGSAFRAAFENEFGCASSVSMWTIARQTRSGQYTYDDKPFPTDHRDIRIYYGITPAYGFSDGLTANSLTDPNYESTNAALWYFSRSENRVYPQAMVDNHGDSSPQKGYYLHATKDGQSIVADFEFKYDRDDLFYRLLTFYGQTGVDGSYAALGTTPQYVPFSLQDDRNVATIPYGNAIEDGSGNIAKVFDRWTTEETRPEAFELSLYADEVLGTYEENLAYVGTSLYAQYRDVGIGMMYLEFGAQPGPDKAGSAVNEQVMGYSGYLTPGQSRLEKLLDNSTAIQSWGYYVLVPAASDTGVAPKATGSDVSIAKTPIDVTIGGGRYKAYQVTARGNKNRVGNLQASFFLTGDADKKYSYVINVNFACAVATNSTDVGAWGENESPWKVRYATQFPGALPLNDKVQAAYAGHAFEQTHTLDMADAKTIKFDNVFTGSYDGGSEAGCTVKNVQRCLDVSYYVGDSSNTSVSRGSGMFPKIEGTKSERAEIKNIAIEISGSDFGEDAGGVYRWSTNSPYAHVGILIGTMEYCDVQNCSIVGSEESVPTINLVLLSGQVRGWGVLFGGAENCTVSSCRVESITFVASRNSEGVWNGSPRIGGLGGQAISTAINECTVENVTVGTTHITEEVRQNQDKGVVYIGGLVGEITGETSTCTQVKAHDVTLRVAAEQYDATWKRGLYFGGLAGTSEVALGESDTFETISLEAGDGKHEVAEAAGMKPEPADPASVEAEQIADLGQAGDLGQTVDPEFTPAPEEGSAAERDPGSEGGPEPEGDSGTESPTDPDSGQQGEPPAASDDSPAEAPAASDQAQGGGAPL
ncbi:prepilin-type N-terminal cleavage/methylation domain-containing protein [Raoultibacter phocaeensis]|uniref:prepilin-type N-terminal cleavage/methylation domain-containing protein n=1 Tax=Raoultibacter phocaeensis TaxID=2479841 RepID=UPI00111ABB8E|nr:prepilin-type N-terminal cleavage/methylation domain-containing protein [Raoultibacter phocaeensis]